MLWKFVIDIYFQSSVILSIVYNSWVIAILLTEQSLSVIIIVNDTESLSGESELFRTKSKGCRALICGKALEVSVRRMS